jgi:hypothetical protein
LDGEDGLPDIYPCLPAILRCLEKFVRPNNPRNTVRRVLRYLDWYLDPGGPVSVGAFRKLLRASMILCLILLPLWLWIAWQDPPQARMALLVWGCLSPLLVFALVVWLHLRGAADQIAAEEFFNYLWQTLTTEG